MASDELQRLAQEDPKQLLAILKDAKKKAFRPHAAQKTILDSTARYRVANCGRRFGKSELASHVLITKSRTPNQLLWWVAPTYAVVKRGYDMVVKKLPEGVLAKPAPPSSNFDQGRKVILHFKNGTKMEFYSAERPDGMLGAAVDFAVLDEAAIMPAHIWNQVVRPTLLDHEGGALMISTPRGKNWFYDAWLKGQDANKAEWDSWTYTSKDNPFLPEGAAEEMAADLPRAEAQQEIYAVWLAEGAQVFIIPPEAKDPGIVMESGLVWDPDEDGNPLNPRIVNGAVFLGVDLARTNDYTVLYGTREIDRKNVFYERFNNIKWEEQRRRIKRAVRTLMRAGAEYVTLVIDEGNGGTIIVEDFQEAGFSAEGVNFTSKKQNMVRLLATDLEVGHAFVLEDCQYSEFENYAMTQTAKGVLQYSAPDGQHDDVVSSKMLSHWGCVNFGTGNVQLLEVSRSSEPDPWEERDPWDEDDDGGDLLDEEVQAAYDIGLVDSREFLYRVPTVAELMNRDDLWG